MINVQMISCLTFFTRGVIVSLIVCISSKVKLTPCLQDLINSSYDF